MKNYAFALPCLFLCAAGVAAAQTAVPAKVGVIQIQSAIVSTKDGQVAAGELENRFAPRRKDLERKQGELKELQDKLQRGGNTMAQAAKEELQRSIDQKTKSLNRDTEDASAEYETEQRKLVDELGQKIMLVIDKYAQANGFAVILDVSNPNTPVLYASNTVDITKEIIDLYDKTQPTAPAAKPSPASSAPKPAAAPVKPPATQAAPTPAPAKKQP